MSLRLPTDVYPYWKKEPEEPKETWIIFSLPLNASAWPGEGAFLSIFCSARQHSFGRRGKSLGAVEIYNFTLLMSPSTRAGFLRKKSVPPVKGKEQTFGCWFQLFSNVEQEQKLSNFSWKWNLCVFVSSLTQNWILMRHRASSFELKR